MPTQWANPVGVNSPVRALDIVGLREAIDRDRMPYGLPPYPWTDPALGAGTPVKAVHYLEPAAAIADLWSRKNMGPLPVWTQGAPGVGTPVRASHLTDLRTWLNTYETNPTGRLTGPLRGLHLRNGDDMRDVDVTAARWFDPGLVVVLSPDVLRPNMKAYLQSLAPGVELFCRYYKTTYPFGSYVTFEGYGPGGPLGDWLRDGQGNLAYGGTSAEQKNPPQVAQDIVDLYDAFLAAGVNITRFYVGNEPELEWFPNQSVLEQHLYTVHLWDDLNAYYRDVYHQVQTIKGGRPIELFPPAFVASAFLGIGGYFADGTVSRTFLQGTMDETGADRVRSAIEFYTNGTQAGSVLYTNYFWPGRSNAAQVAFDYFPQWLKDHITNDGYVSRITEWGWFPDSFQPPQVGCLAELDTTDHPCDSPQPEIHSWSDYNDWARHRTQSGGAAMWILSTTAGGLFEQQAAVTAGGVIRDWFKRFCAFADANL